MPTDKVFRYDLHCHTSIASVCGRILPEDLAKWYADLGYSGFCLTDHFSGADPFPGLSWESRVDAYWAAYMRTREAGERLGLSVFFGIEYSLVPDPEHFSESLGNDFLIYNITKEYLRDNRSMFGMKPAELFKKIRGDGGFIVHAHPYAETWYIEFIRLIPRSVDAVETLNGNKSLLENDMAKAYAEAYGLLETAGSDCHNRPWPYMCGLETDAPCHTLPDLVSAIRGRQTRPFAIKITGEAAISSDKNIIIHPSYPATRHSV